jgi:HD-GYP domain-containing protein (c-di-GMP phosphodiesterase class II)
VCEPCLLDRRRGKVAERDRHWTALVEALVAALDLREHQTGLHSKRVACHTLVLARHFMGDAARLQQVYWGGLLHDLGKIGVPDAVLLKAGPLTPEEWTIMRRHPAAGHAVLVALPGMEAAADIVLRHEERFDGSGYPDGLRGARIPLGARLFAVIDTLDAMTSDRPYRRGQDYDRAKAEIVGQAGRQFDPEVVECFLREEAILREMVDLGCSDPGRIGAAAEFRDTPIAIASAVGYELPRCGGEHN